MTDLSLVASHPEVGTGLAARGSQRARLVEGMIQAVAEKGYANATVADAVRAALAERPELRMPSDDALFILSAGVDQLICARVRAGALDTLPDLTDELTLTAVAFLEGAAAIKATHTTSEGAS